MMLSFRRLVIGGVSVSWGGRVGGPTQVIEKTCSEKILFMSGLFFGAISGSELALVGAHCLVNAFWCLFAYVLTDCFVFFPPKCR